MTQPTPIFSEEAEEALLGALLTDDKHMTQVATFLQPHMLYSYKLRAIYTAMYRLHERRDPIDAITIVEELRTFDDGRKAYIHPGDITALMGAVPTSAHAGVYARLIERLYVRRALVETGTRMVALAADENKATEDVVGDAEREFARVRNYAFTEGQTMADANDAALAEVQAAMHAPNHISGIPSGLDELDALTTGWQSDESIVLAGRPGMGKTSAALKFMLSAMAAGKRVMMFSMEMNRTSLLKRLYAQKCNVPYGLMAAGKMTQGQYNEVFKASNSLHADIADHRLEIDDKAAITPEYMRMKALGIKHRYGLDLLVIDYLQLMHGADERHGRTETVTALSRAIKVLARELGIPVLLLSQLSRAVEGRQDKRPILSDLRDSGGIEQDADKVIFLYRDAVYNATTDNPYLAELILAKHRNGPTGTAFAYFNGPLMRFENGKTRHVDLKSGA